MPTDTVDVRDELRAVIRDLLGGVPAGSDVDGRLLREGGWLGLDLPEPLGGGGATFAEVAVVLTEFGRAATGTPYLGPVVLGIGTLAATRPGPARDALLRDAAGGDTALAAAVIDGADDSGSADPPFRIEPATDGFLVHGRAGFVPDAATADRILAVARDPAGTPVVVLLFPGTAGLAVTAPPLLDASRRFGQVRTDAVAVPEAAVLPFDGPAEPAVERILDRAATAVAADSLGLAEAMLDATVAYARTRHQFGRPIGSFQAVKHACADMLVRISVARHLVADAARSIAANDAGAGVAASMAKSYVGAAAVDVVGKAMQLHGGMGYTWESGIHGYLKRAMLNRSLFGSPAAHRRRLAHRYR